MNQDSSHEDEWTQVANKKMRQSPEPTTEDAKPKGTLYITVGPQCSGKTTTLKHIFGKSFHKNEEVVLDSSITKEEVLTAGVDITIDDQALVYIPVPTVYFLENSTSSNDAKADITTNLNLSLNQTIFGKTIHERMFDQSNQELRSVIQRLGGALSAEQFALLNGGNETAKNDLIDAVEHVIQLQMSSKLQMGEVTKNQSAVNLPETTDLFIVESIFRPRPLEIMQKISNEQPSAHNNVSSSEAQSALDHSLQLIKSHATNPQIHAPTAPLSWGNTNTRPREFQSALEAAVLSGRPVEFIVFGGLQACGMIREHVSRREYRKMGQDREEKSTIETNATTDDDEGLLCLPKVDRRTLLVRNVQRFLRTGRYVPSTAISDAMVRVESLLASAVAEANKDYNSTEGDQQISMSCAKFRLDSELVKLAGYRLNDNKTVSATDSTLDNTNGGNNPDRRNDRHARSNSYQYGTGNNRGRYYEERGRGYGGRGYGSRGGRSSSRSTNNWHQNNRTSYNNSGRGYDRDPRREWGRGSSGEYRRGSDNYGRGAQHSENTNVRDSNGRGWGRGRGWNQEPWGRDRGGRYN